MAALRTLKDEREPPVKKATSAVRDKRGFVPSYAGGRVRRIPVQ